jgi:hypothetical protein
MIFLVIFMVFVIIAQGLVIRRMGRSLTMYKNAFSRALQDTGMYHEVKDILSAFHKTTL